MLIAEAPPRFKTGVLVLFRSIEKLATGAKMLIKCEPGFALVSCKAPCRLMVPAENDTSASLFDKLSPKARLAELITKLPLILSVSDETDVPPILTNVTLFTTFAGVVLSPTVNDAQLMAPVPCIVVVMPGT